MAAAGSASAFEGRYERRPIDNAWHSVTVTSHSSGLLWRNDANVEWDVTVPGGDGAALTSARCPYGVLPCTFTYAPGGAVSHLTFQSEEYVRCGGPAAAAAPLPVASPPRVLPRAAAPAIAVCPGGGHAAAAPAVTAAQWLTGTYRREPVENAWHVVTISGPHPGEGATLRWSNDAGVVWHVEAGGALATAPGGGSWTTTSAADCPYGVRPVSFSAGSLTFFDEVYTRTGDAVSVAVASAGARPAAVDGAVGGASAGAGAAAAAGTSCTLRADAALAAITRCPAGLTPLGMEALETFLAVTQAYQGGKFAAARSMLDALWAAHPPGDAWWPAAARMHGCNFGAPTCLYAFRMVTRAVAHMDAVTGGGGPGGAGAVAPVTTPLSTYNLRIVAVRTADGRMPPTAEALDACPAGVGRLRDARRARGGAAALAHGGALPHGPQRGDASRGARRRGARGRAARGGCAVKEREERVVCFAASCRLKKVF
jgi:hypothetical protein